MAEQRGPDAAPACGCLGGGSRRAAAAPPGPRFLHGVGSFDPLPDRVLLWTRVTPPPTTAGGRVAVALPVRWEVAAAPDFRCLVAAGDAEAREDDDFTVTVDAAGLPPAARLFYRFIACGGGARSPVGVTRTAAAGRLDELTYAVVNCANWGFGYFNVYDLAAKVDGLDLVLHIGDYIYEYEKYRYPERYFNVRHGLRPRGRLSTLRDYRERYACYRTDEALQELHRRVPFIYVPDDHEFGDEATATGAADFDGTPEQWQAKKAAALRALAEWVPVRGVSDARGADGARALDPAAFHRAFHFGDLATLVLLENRISARTPSVDVKTTEFYAETAKKPPREWDPERIAAAKEKLMDALRDPARRIVGPAQVEGARAAVAESVAGGRPWQLVATGVVAAQLKAPRLLATLPLQPAPLRWVCAAALKVGATAWVSGQEAAELARMYVAMGKYGVPMNPNAWDGYAAERAALLAAVAQPGANPVFHAGDSHNAWASELVDAGGRRVGVELDAPSVTSIGFAEEVYSRFEAKLGRVQRLLPLYVFQPWIRDALHAANPDTLKYCNLVERGLLVVHVTRRRLHAEFMYVSTVKRPAYKPMVEAAFYAEAGDVGRLHAAPRYVGVEGRIPKKTRRKRVAFVETSHDIKKG